MGLYFRMKYPTENAGGQPTAHYLPLRRVAAVGIGNALEFYDFITFSFFSIQIGHSFFPVSQTSHGLLFTLATFGVGFLTRPLGGFLIGRYGDRAGRKPAMMLSFSLMGFAILGLALTPSYTRIGVAAPILLLAFRLLQGLALGGQVGPSTAYLVEAAAPLQRGLYVALQYATQDCAVLAAGIVGFVLSSLLSPDALDAWGWRFALLLGTAVVPVGLYMRGSLPETFAPANNAALAAAERHVPPLLIVLALMMLGAGTIANYALIYLTTYAQDSLHLATNVAFVATIVNGLFAVFGDITSGMVSDRVGRKPLMLSAVALLILLVVPSFMAMEHFRSAMALYAATALLTLLLSGTIGPALVTITETLPKAVRSGALALIYAAAIAVAGGSTQFTIKWLTDATGNPLAPAWYVTGALAIGAVAMLIVAESAPVRNARRGASVT